MFFRLLVAIIFRKTFSWVQSDRFTLLAIDQAADCESVAEIFLELEDSMVEKFGGHVNVLIMNSSQSEDGVSVQVSKVRKRYLITVFGGPTAQGVARGLDSLTRYVYNAS